MSDDEVVTLMNLAARWARKTTDEGYSLTEGERQGFIECAHQLRAYVRAAKGRTRTPVATGGLR